MALSFFKDSYFCRSLVSTLLIYLAVLYVLVVLFFRGGIIALSILMTAVAVLLVRLYMRARG